jgi:hypothetical protein
MDTLKQEITRQLEELSPEELRAVHQLITTFKHSPEQTQDENAEQFPKSEAPAPEAVDKVREALGHVSGALSDVIAEEREERI